MWMCYIQNFFFLDECFYNLLVGFYQPNILTDIASSYKKYAVNKPQK